MPLAEIAGEAALFLDLRARLYISWAILKSAYVRAPEGLKALCEAWAVSLYDFGLTVGSSLARLNGAATVYYGYRFQQRLLPGYSAKPLIEIRVFCCADIAGPSKLNDIQKAN